MIYRAAKAHLNQLKSLALTTSLPTSNASSGGEMANVARVRKFAKLSIGPFIREKIRRVLAKTRLR